MNKEAVVSLKSCVTAYANSAADLAMLKETTNHETNALDPLFSAGLPDRHTVPFCPLPHVAAH